MPKAVLIVTLFSAAVLLQGCIATVVGAAAGATIGVAGAAVGATVKTVGAVGRAVIPGGDDKDKR